jgi:Ca2+-binding RTX toxin-like protein
MANGTVTTTGAAIGSDTLRSVEAVIGTRFADTYVATGFDGSSTNAGSIGTFNAFQSAGGGDTITGNGNTQLGYFTAGAGVTADLQTGIATAAGDPGFGTDHFTGVNAIVGSGFRDILSGDSAANFFDGQGGNDRLNGRGGNDVLTGGLGGDTFIHSTGGGADTINDFNRGQLDKIDVSGVSGIFGLTDIQSRASTVGGNTVIDFGGGNTITVLGVTASSLVASDFVFAGGPVIDTEHFTTSSSGENEPTTVIGLSVTNVSAGEALTLTATTAEAVSSGSTITPSSGSGNLTAINGAIGSVVYDPGSTPPDDDMVTFTVSGASGSDTVNFIFIQAGTAPNPTLQGTSGKDVIFATEGNDTLTGGAGKDQFVFSDTLSGAVHTITDFETPLDKIDLREFTAVHSLTDISVTQDGSSTLVSIGNDSILLQNVLPSNVHPGNFIFHSVLVA